MDPLIVFDCAIVLPNRFALALAAAARSRALNRGAEPRFYGAATSSSERALHEIAAGAFTDRELRPFLADCRKELSLPALPMNPEMRGVPTGNATLPATRLRAAIH